MTPYTTFDNNSVDYTSFTNKDGVEHIRAEVIVTQLEALGTVEAG